MKYLGISSIKHVKISLPRWRIICSTWPLCSRGRGGGVGRKGTLPQRTLWILKVIYSSFGCTVQPTYQGICKAASFKQVQNKKRLCPRSKLLYKLLCHLGHLLEQIQWWLKMLIADKDAGGSLDRSIIHSTCPWGWETMSWYPSRILTLLWKIALDLLLSLRRDWTLNYVPPNYHATWAARHELGVIWPTKLGGHSSTLIRWQCFACDWVWTGPKARVSYMKKWPQCPWSSGRLHCPFSPSLHRGPHEESPILDSRTHS